ncbi:MAG TPA: hypothetical protein VD735_03530 [Candidatus Saccharimonadales bacterium]|nr:hypothetical protein [Candidatus Saccharimonadales bacterium]
MAKNETVYKVEYLLLLEGDNITCTKVDSLLHLLQSDSDIVISENNKSATYRGNQSFDVDIDMGSAGQGKASGSIYFDMSFSCNSEADLNIFGDFLRSVRVVLSPLFPKNPDALQILRDDLSLYYRIKAYPLISEIENSMRRLITKFMQVNVGMGWTRERVPDEISKNKFKNEDTTFLHNVDFINLKELLLSQNYSKHKESLINNLKTSQKETFTKAEIESLIPVSNWDRYFSAKIKVDAEELDNDWTQLYELRCKVAHNRTFTSSDLTRTETLGKKVVIILEAAQQELDSIHVNEDEAQGIAEDAVLNSASAKELLEMFLGQWRGIERHVIKLANFVGDDPANYRNLADCVRGLESKGYIPGDTANEIGDLARVKNIIVHLDNKVSPEVIENHVGDLRRIANELFRIRMDRKYSLKKQTEKATKQ